MKFTIRDLFLVTVIVAVCLAWWLDRRRLSQVIERQNAKMKEDAERMTAEAQALEARVKALLDPLPVSAAPARFAPPP